MVDPYVYPGTNLLKNKFDCHDEVQFQQIEADYTSLRLRELATDPINGKFDITHLCEWHQYIFQDIFEWAGQLRSVDIFKEEEALAGMSIDYAPAKIVSSETNEALLTLQKTSWEDMTVKERAIQFSKAMASLWKAHPFREGNTRTVVTFCCHLLEKQGIGLDQKLFAQNSGYMRKALVAASSYFSDLGDISKPEYLEQIVQDSMERGIQQRKERFTKNFGDLQREPDDEMEEEMEI